MGIGTVKNSEEEIQEFMRKLALSILPQLIVQHGLEEEFEKDKDATLSKILEEIKDEDTFNDDSMIFVIKDKYTQLHDIENYMNLHKELVDKFPEMFLFKIFSIFEGFINHYLYSEVVLNYDFSLNKVSKILSKLSVSDKVDWFMEIVVGKSFLGHSAWGEIKPFLNVRNSLVHLKPMQSSKETELKEKITFENLLYLKEQIVVISKEISQTQSIKMLENEDKIAYIRGKL
ncbi:hypothetical protein CSE16_08740 [Solibacillus sp. R5-41]|uniref:hypothetical protein n=1 Tax=Solibacillus sp. R5-41 TaxID=2048654 RepID=UPI000C125D81|nr:hypothetical protein [Solibacillus sp. R5-41]ATP40131.1 hypothetical protein CSE16_08740 [Solibacillus sp. R5-41]